MPCGEHLGREAHVPGRIQADLHRVGRSERSTNRYVMSYGRDPRRDVDARRPTEPAAISQSNARLEVELTTGTHERGAADRRAWGNVPHHSHVKVEGSRVEDWPGSDVSHQRGLREREVARLRAGSDAKTESGDP